MSIVNKAKWICLVNASLHANYWNSNSYNHSSEPTCFGNGFVHIQPFLYGSQTFPVFWSDIWLSAAFWRVKKLELVSMPVSGLKKIHSPFSSTWGSSVWLIPTSTMRIKTIFSAFIFRRFYVWLRRMYYSDQSVWCTELIFTVLFQYLLMINWKTQKIICLVLIAW